jgi:hypothetical protein
MRVHSVAAIAFDRHAPVARTHRGLNVLLLNEARGYYCKSGLYLKTCRALGISPLAYELFSRPTEYTCIAYPLLKDHPRQELLERITAGLKNALQAGDIKAYQFGSILQLTPSDLRRQHYPDFLDLTC